MYASFFDELRKIAFQQSEFSTPIEGPRRSRLASHLPPFTAPELLVKRAAPRAVREWRNASDSGDMRTADGIAKAYGDAKLSPRYLEDISTGGGEAGVDLMMGNKNKDLPGGYIARKLYKPDSPLHRGDVTDEVLQQKQQLTDLMMSDTRSAPFATDMAGHERLPTGNFASYHEYVPGAVPLGDVSLNEHRPSMLRSVVDNVVTPLAEKGKRLEDVVQETSPGSYVPNLENIAVDRAGQPRVLDFLPNEIGVGSKLKSFLKDNPNLPPSKFGYNPSGVAGLRRAVFRKLSAMREELLKLSFQTSQFSGPLSYGGFKQTSHLPPFSSPAPAMRAVRTEALRVNPASTAPVVKAAAAGYGTMIPAVSSPASSLAMTRKVGQGKFGGGPGPSIGQISKPVNFGKGSPVGPTIAGATKS